MDKEQKLLRLIHKIKKCTRCSLYKSANQAVSGEGNPKAKIMFIGESPGFWEDKEGRPFIGQAGKLLDYLLQLIKLTRKEVFITNLVKHRPPANRDPLPKEIKACELFLDKQIEVVDPKIIITLGRFSMAKFLPTERISQVHGQMKSIYFAGEKRIILPMYHPAAALRSSIIRKKIEQDFLKIKREVIKCFLTQKIKKD